VQAISDKSVIPTTTALERLLGEDVQVTAREQVLINNYITSEYISVNFSGNSLPEEHGRLFLYPIADGQFSLHLLYLQPGHDAMRAEVSWIQFLPPFFDQYPAEALLHNTPFRFDQTTEQQFNVCIQARTLLESLRATDAITPLIQSLQLTEAAVQLLRRAIENVTVPFTVCPVPACRFLAHEAEREKIFSARSLIEQTIDQPLTIKELSRKVAMNECYLKKGFKTLTGKTINEYQQELRITRAKVLLQQQGQTVSQVASALGYSSISHFSTAFKKATGLKPCELLG
jgi:AraC-like DNA-binding protein